MVILFHKMLNERSILVCAQQLTGMQQKGILFAMLDDSISTMQYRDKEGPSTVVLKPKRTIFQLYFEPSTLEIKYEDKSILDAADCAFAFIHKCLTW